MDVTAHKKAFNAVGWFIPPYVTVGSLDALRLLIDRGIITDQSHLELALAPLFTPQHLAAMVCERYPITPFVRDYESIIAEAVEAHFMGLGHVSVAGLAPVIEGVGRKLVDSRSIKATSIKEVFSNLAADCIEEVKQKNIGAVDELVSMMEAFSEFTSKFLYAGSSSYPLDDNTNRHGILHGAFTDADYGRPISFFKIVGALDFLCLVSALRAHISWLAPDETEKSTRLAQYYRECISLSKSRPARS